MIETWYIDKFGTVIGSALRAGRMCCAIAGVPILGCLASCGGGGSADPLPAQRAALACLSPQIVTALQEDAAQVVTAREFCDAELNSSLGSLGLAADEINAVFATIATYASFSASSAAGPLAPDEQFAVRTQVLLQQLRTVPGMAPVVQMAQSDFDDTALHIVSVFGGAIGNRAQLVYEGTVNQLLLDPWTGVVAKAGFDDIFSGTPIPMINIQSYALAAPTAAQESNEHAVLAALVGGGYRPSDLLYFQPYPEFYQLVSTVGDGALTDTAQLVAAEYTTPGGYGLAVEAYGLVGVPIPQPARFSASELQSWVSWSELQPNNHQLQCLADGAVNAIRTDPNAVIQLRQSCDAELSTVLAAWQFSATELNAVFATIVSHNMAPWGPNSTLLLAGLLEQPTLECAGYAALAGYLMDILSQGAPHDPLRALGYLHPVFGNHVELFYDEGARALLLDPTVGFVAIEAPYDGFFSGQPVAASQIATFYQYAPAKTDFVEEVYNSIRFGKYRPSDLMYFSPYPQFLAGQWEISATAADWLMYRYLTPGGYRKAVQLGFSG